MPDKQNQPQTYTPAGWTVRAARNGEVIVSAPQGMPGGMTLTGKERPLPQRLLYALACDILSSQASHNWLESMPTAPGLYWMQCGESDSEPVQIYVFERSGVLMSVSDSGVVGLDAFHTGLTQPLWARIPVPEPVDSERARDSLNSHPH